VENQRDQVVGGICAAALIEFPVAIILLYTDRLVGVGVKKRMLLAAQLIYPREIVRRTGRPTRTILVVSEQKSGMSEAGFAKHILCERKNLAGGRR